MFAQGMPPSLSYRCFSYENYYKDESEPYITPSGGPAAIYQLDLAIYSEVLNV